MGWTEVTQRMHNHDGFGRDKALLTNIKFSAMVTVMSIREKTTRGRTEHDEPKKYFTIVDEFGAMFSVRDENLIEKISVGLRYSIEGSVKVVRGGTFLNVLKINDTRNVPVKYATEKWKEGVVERCEALPSAYDLLTDLEEFIKEERWVDCARIEHIIEQMERNLVLDEEGILPF